MKAIMMFLFPDYIIFKDDFPINFWKIVFLKTYKRIKKNKKYYLNINMYCNNNNGIKFYLSLLQITFDNST